MAAARKSRSLKPVQARIIQTNEAKQKQAKQARKEAILGTGMDKDKGKDGGEEDEEDKMKKTKDDEEDEEEDEEVEARGGRRDETTIRPSVHPSGCFFVVFRRLSSSSS
ncbi:hypothetical protein GTR04_7568 [Trichophyton interdigitale]|nr:hypothetical protein GY631_7558 [Trichophyton interdigitale]KAG5216454.1 hypothetical protein GY632_7539 [Trichophyton interdigitale]KAG8205050.1 hypothetical protein GTR04_7568 [Trichophyton interdigitale]